MNQHKNIQNIMYLLNSKVNQLQLLNLRKVKNTYLDLDCINAVKRNFKSICTILIDNINLNTVLDSGSADSFIHPNMVDKLSLPVSNIDAKAQQQHKHCFRQWKYGQCYSSKHC